MKLGGWQRLWIFIAALNFVAVTLYAAFNYPKAETTYHRTEFYERMGKESILILTNALDSKDIIRVEMPNGHQIKFAASTPQEQMQLICRQYYEVVAKHVATERRSFFGLAFLTWLLPLVALYVIGAAVGWIYKGFRAS